MDEDRLPSEQERSEPNQVFSSPLVTGVAGFAVNPTSQPDIRVNIPGTVGNVTTTDAARLLEEVANTDTTTPSDGDRAPRVRKNKSDRKYERRSHVNSQVSSAIAEVKILMPVTLNSASLNLLPTCFNQLQTSTHSLSQEPRISDATQPSGYQNFVRVVHPPSTESALPNLQAPQPSAQPSFVLPIPVIDTARSSQVPAASISLPAQPLITVINPAIALTPGYSYVRMGHPPLTESAMNLHSNTSSQQQNMCSPSPLLNFAFLSPQLSLSLAPNQLFENTTLPSGIPNVQMVPYSASKSSPPGARLLQTNQQLGSVRQERLISQPASKNSEACMLQGMDVTKVNAVEADRLMQPGIIQASLHSAVAVQATKQGSTILQISGLPQPNEARAVNATKSTKKPHLLPAPQKAKESANQTAQRLKMCYTQLWKRNKFGTPSSRAKQQHTSQQTQPQKDSCSDKIVRREKQRSDCTHHRDVLNSSWDRIIVSSDIVSQLSLQDIRRGIEAFLESRINHQMIVKDRQLYLHWDGKDLGTFQYKKAVTSIPTITTEETITISSSDDEVIEDDTATPVTPLPVGTSDGVTHDKHVTAGCSQESAWEGIKDHLEPLVLLAECTSSDSEDCSDRDDLSYYRKAVRSSDEDPTYIPDEEEISSEDKTSPDNSDTEVCSKPSSGSFVNPSAYNGFDESSTQDLLIVLPTEKQYSINPLMKGHNEKHIGSCGNLSTKKRQLRDLLSRSNARKRKHVGDSFDSSHSDMDISSDESSSSKQRRSAKKSRARRPRGCPIPKTTWASVISEISVPADIICPPCRVELLPLKDNIFHDGRVNLSAIKEEELIATDNNVTTSDETWARVANALSFAPELYIGSPW